MAEAAMLAFVAVPAAALVCAARREMKRQQKEWNELGPLDSGHSEQNLRESDEDSMSASRSSSSGSLQVSLKDLVPASTFIQTIGEGVRIYDPFLVIQTGDHVKCSPITEGLYHTVVDRIPFNSTPFRFPAPLLEPPEPAEPSERPEPPVEFPTMRIFLYGRKHKKSSQDERRLIAAGTIPVQLALEKELAGMSIPLMTRKGIRAGFVRVKVKRELEPPALFVAREEDSDNSEERVLHDEEKGRRQRPVVVFSFGQEQFIAVPEGRSLDGIRRGPRPLACPSAAGVASRSASERC